MCVCKRESVCVCGVCVCVTDRQTSPVLNIEDF